jgi:hypothetical protein
MSHKLHAMYGNAGHRFPRTTGEAFGPGAAIFVADDCDEDEEINEAIISFSVMFGAVVYTLAAIVICVILWGPK